MAALLMAVALAEPLIPDHIHDYLKAAQQQRLKEYQSLDQTVERLEAARRKSKPRERAANSVELDNAKRRMKVLESALPSPSSISAAKPTKGQFGTIAADKFRVMQVIDDNNMLVVPVNTKFSISFSGLRAITVVLQIGGRAGLGVRR